MMLMGLCVRSHVATHTIVRSRLLLLSCSSCFSERWREGGKGREGGREGGEGGGREGKEGGGGRGGREGGRGGRGREEHMKQFRC